MITLHATISNSIKDEEILACGNVEGIIYVSSGETDERQGDWEIADHLRHTGMNKHILSVSRPFGLEDELKCFGHDRRAGVNCIF